MFVREESVDPTLPNVPPAGSIPADLDLDFGEFDYDAVKADEGAELWLVRAPTAVKAKNLHGVQVLPPSSVAGRVGDLLRKTTAYDIWSLWPPSFRQSSGSSGGDHRDPPHLHVGAEELNSLSVLLPRKRKGGKLFLAPTPVTRHLVVAARPAEPTRPGPGDTTLDPATFQNPPREAYPDEALTHRFRPYGDPGDPPPPPENQMDLDVDDEHAEEGGAREKEKERRKKRRGDEAAGSPKKTKKAKMAAS